jgi:tetratricopeptide (TPR) repeat protein
MLLISRPGRYNLGNYYSKTKDIARAEENYLEAIALDNLLYPAKINLALIYYQQGKTGPAEKLFIDMVANHPEVMDGYYYLALLYGEQKRYAEAIGLLETAKIMPGVNPRIFYNLGLLYRMTGQDDKGEATLIAGLKQDSCNFDILYALFTFYMQKNDRAKAKPYMRKLKICYPNDKQVEDLYVRSQRSP